jgi:hypothetical protein
MGGKKMKKKPRPPSQKLAIFFRGFLALLHICFVIAAVDLRQTQDGFDTEPPIGAGRTGAVPR